MNKLQAYADHLATKRNVLLVFGLVILQSLFNASSFLPHLFGYAGTIGVYTLDQAIWRSPSYYQTILAAWGVAGRMATLKVHVTFDILYPLMLATLLVLGNNLFWRRLHLPPRARLAMLIIPLLGCGFDVLENTGIVLMILSFPHQPDWLVNLTRVCTLGKFSFDALGILAVLCGGVRWLKDRLLPSKQSLTAT